MCLYTNKSLSDKIARAKSHRIFSPLDKTEYGFNQEGGELNPTELNAFDICSTLQFCDIS